MADGVGNGWAAPGAVVAPKVPTGGVGTGSGWESPGGGGVVVHAPHHGGGIMGFLGGAGHWIASKASLAGHDIKQIPAGAIQQGQAAFNDFISPTIPGLGGIHVGGKHFYDVGVGGGAAGSLGATDNPHFLPMLKGMAVGAKTAAAHPLRDPFASVMWLAPGLHGAGRVGLGAAEGAAALRAGEGIEAARAAMKSPALLRTPRMLTAPGGEPISLATSRNALARIYQAAHDKYVQRMINSNPESVVAKYGASRMHGTLSEVSRARVRMQKSVVANLRRASAEIGNISKGFKLENGSKTLAQAAIELVSHNTTPEEAILRSEHAISQGTQPELNAANIQLYKEVQQLDLVHTLGEDVGINPAFERLAKTEAILNRGATALDQEIASRGLRPEEQLTNRRNLPAAVTQRLTPFAEPKITPAMRDARATFERVDSVYQKALDQEARWRNGEGPKRTQGPGISPGGLRAEGTLEQSNPYRNRIVQLGIKHEAALQRLQRLERSQGVQTSVPEDLQARQELLRFVEGKFGAKAAAQSVGLLDRRAAQFARETDLPAAHFYRQHLKQVETLPEITDAHLADLLEIAPFHGFAAEKTGKNLRAKLNPRTQESGRPSSKAVLTKEGIHFSGDITPEAWVARVLHTIPDLAERDYAARWYEHFEPVFRKHFPKEIVEKIMRAFAVSQANAGVSEGIGSSLVGHARLEAGEPVTRQSLASLAADNIEKAIKGEHIDSGVAAKLSDFIDALRGSETRTWMGHDVRGGAPAPSDVWSGRDIGHIDQKIGSKKRDARLLRLHGVDVNKLEKTSNGSYSGRKYEYIAEKYHAITEHLNAVKFDGRDDWTPAQAQALGWSTIQKFYGEKPEDLAGAILKGHKVAAGIMSRNELKKAVESAQAPDGGFTLHPDLSPDTGKEGFAVALAPYEKRIPAAELTTKDLTDYARTHKQILRNPNLRVGGWHNPDDGMVYLDITRVAPTREEAMTLAREHGQLSVFDRGAAAQGDWDSAFPSSGLSESEADAIKNEARVKAKSPEEYKAFIRSVAERELERKPSAHDMALVEDRLHAAAEAHPEDPASIRFSKLYDDAHHELQSREPQPEELFSRERLDSLNPTGGLFAEYAPHSRAESQLGGHLTTLDKTMGVAPEATVTIHRGAPEHQQEIAPGDFVTTNQQLARDYGGHVISKQVPASHVLDDASEPLGEEYIYRPPSLHQEGGGRILGSYSPASATMRFSEKHALEHTVTHEALHAIRQSLPELLQRKFERRYGINGGEWSRAHEEKFVEDMLGVHEGTVTDPETVRMFHQLTAFVPGRSFTPLTTLERGAPQSSMAAARGPVVGLAADPLNKNFTTGSGLLNGMHAADVVDSVARHWNAVHRFFNTQDWRDLVAKTGSTTRRSSRDILVRVDNRTEGGVPIRPEAISNELEQVLGRRHSTAYTPEVDAEEAGVMASLQGYVDHLFPGRDPFSEHAALEKTAPEGFEAPQGFKWVDSKTVGDMQTMMPPGGPNVIGRFIDNINSAVTAATVYFKIGHVTTRYLTNAATNIMQGSANPLSLKQATEVWHELNPDERIAALASAGTHYYEAIPGAEGEGRVARIVQHGVPGTKTHVGSPQWWAGYVDAPFRFNSLAYEVRKSAYGSGADAMRQYLTDLKEYNRLEPHARAEVDGIVRRSNREAIAYDRLGPNEKKYLSRAVWFYPWVKGSTVWTAGALIEHPFKSAYAVQTGVEGRKQQEAEFGDVPSYSYGVFSFAHGTVADFSTFNPMATAADLTQLPAHTGELAGMLNPALGAVDEIAHSTDAFGRHTNKPWTTALHDLVSSAPEAQILQAYLDRNTDQSHREYPGGPQNDAFAKTWLGEVIRMLLGPGAPRRFNPDAAHSLAERERTGR